MIGRSIGAKNKRQAEECIGNTVTMFMGISMVLMAVLLVLVRPIVGIMSTPAEAVEGTVRYLTICFIGIPLSQLIILSAPFSGGWGILRVRCIFYCGGMYGQYRIGLSVYWVAGVGYDRCCPWNDNRTGNQCSCIDGCDFERKGGIRLEKSDFRPKRMTMKNILKVGVPVCLQDGFIQVSFVVITIFANQRGLTDAAAVGIVEKIISILFLVPSS